MRNLALTACLFGAFAGPVEARVPCGPRALLVEGLKKQHGERTRMLGMDARGAILEVWVSEKTGTYTVLLTRPDGVSCLMSSGGSAEFILPTDAGAPL